MPKCVLGACLQLHALLSVLEAQLQLQCLLPAGSQCSLQLYSAEGLTCRICSEVPCSVRIANSDASKQVHLQPWGSNLQSSKMTREQGHPDLA